MSRGNIGLDNPAFQGNVRIYRRRPVDRPQKRPTAQYVLLDDVQDSIKIEKAPVSSPKPVQQIAKTQQSAPSKNISPLQAPVWHTSQAGSEFVGILPAKKPKRLSRSEQFAEWQKQQRIKSSLPSVPQQTSFETNYMQEEAQVEQVKYYEPAESYEDLQSIKHTQAVQRLPIKKRRVRSLLRKTPFFWKLNRKDLLTARFALPAMATTIFLVGCGVAVQGVMTNRDVKAQVQELASASTAAGYDPTGQPDVPDETKPDEKSGPYIVAPDMPRYIRINKIDVFSRIMRVGVKQNNELIAPGNIHNVGWYDGSAKPGEKGTALMDAHVHGPTMPGAFYNIHKLAVGDQIEIEMGDGRKLNYEVVGSENKPYQEVDMGKAMRSLVDGENGLNLITCGGRYNKDSHTYEERVVVYAIQK